MNQYTKCNRILQDVMANVGDTQLRREEYAYISSFLEESNFLVFGTGYDSNYWRCVNKGGLTVFLEDDDEWIDEDSEDVFKVEYTTKRLQADDLIEKYLKGDKRILKLKVPKFVYETEWDVIFVDAPVGNNDEKPGRMQSIFMARELAGKNTNVFVHDCNRYVENLYTTIMFKNRIADLHKLRHLKR